MSNIVEFPSKIKNDVENIVEFDPAASLESLLGQLERACDSIHTNVRQFMVETSGQVIRLSKKADTNNEIRAQLVNLGLLSATKAKKLTTRRLAVFVRKSYWRINEEEKRYIRKLDRLADGAGYFERQRTEKELLEKTDPENIVPLINKDQLSPLLNAADEIALTKDSE